MRREKAVAQGQPVEVLAEVELRYPIEGILGRFLLEREGEGWRIVKAELAER